MRAFAGVGGTPLFIARAKGSTMWDVDGNAYTDYVGSFGPLILGHAHTETMQAITEILEDGWSYGAPTEIEVHLAELICKSVPSIELVRMVNSGTEATMSALRLARAYTKRDKIIKFSGCYHGHADSFLVSAGSGLATLGIPSSPGVPRAISDDTLICPFNDAGAVGDLFDRYPDQIAAVILEPIAGNMGVVPPAPQFLESLRDLTTNHGSLLVFDEVMTGFRVAFGGAQELYGVIPDLTTLGKIIGGGFPVGAYGGRRDIMELVAPAGPVYQAGTLSGNPIAMTAGYVTLSYLSAPSVYKDLEKKSGYFAKELAGILSNLPKKFTLNRVGSMMTLFFTPKRVKNFETAQMSDTRIYSYFFHEMLERHVYLPPSQFEAFFISLAHDMEILDRTLEAARDSLKRLFS
jgi:glutamate-1-semialdehyde 2,1-aminomutase